MTNPTDVNQFGPGVASIGEIDSRIQDLFSKFEVYIGNIGEGVPYAGNRKPVQEARQSLEKTPIESTGRSFSHLRPLRQKYSDPFANSSTPTFDDIVKDRLPGKIHGTRRVDNAAPKRSKNAKVRRESAIYYRNQSFCEMMKEYVVASLDAEYRPVLGLVLHL